MNTKKALTALFLALAFAGTAATQSHAEETLGEKAQAKMETAKNQAKKTYRKAKDKVCDIVNGKVECEAKKLKHRAQNAADKLKAEAKRAKNKAD